MEIPYKKVDSPPPLYQFTWQNVPENLETKHLGNPFTLYQFSWQNVPEILETKHIGKSYTFLGGVYFLGEGFYFFTGGR